MLRSEIKLKYVWFCFFHFISAGPQGLSYWRGHWCPYWHQVASNSNSGEYSQVYLEALAQDLCSLCCELAKQRLCPKQAPLLPAVSSRRASIPASVCFFAFFVGEVREQVAPGGCLEMGMWSLFRFSVHQESAAGESWGNLLLLFFDGIRPKPQGYIFSRLPTRQVFFGFLLYLLGQKVRRDRDHRSLVCVCVGGGSPSATQFLLSSPLCPPVLLSYPSGHSPLLPSLGE